MSLPRLSAHRPVTTLMASIIVALLGWMALRGLPVDLIPELEFPTITVTTLYPGAGPEEIETLITRPLEQALSSVNGFERMSSTSLEGSSSIRVEFNWGADLDVAMDEMRQSIDKIRVELPEQIDPPYMRRYDANDMPVMYLGLNSDTPVTELTRLVERSVMPRLERIDGVARVAMRGDIRREIHVELDRAKLEALGMGVNEVVTALQSGNVSQPAGDFEEGHLHRLIRSRSEFRSLDELRNLIVRRSGDGTVRVRDIAQVVDGHERITQTTRTNGQPGLMMYIFKQAGANTIAVSDAVQAALVDVNRQLQDGQVVVRLDKADFIRESIANIKQAAMLGMGLTMVVLALFLRNWRTTLIIGVSMPLSVLAAFIPLYFCGYSLNMVSFGGLALGIGMLVDNSIVVLESIFKKREFGMSAREAAIRGTEEVAGAITASTLTTLIVFLPLAFITGMAGLLLHQLGFVVCSSLICSLFASLTLTPTLAAFWLPATSGDAPGHDEVDESLEDLSPPAFRPRQFVFAPVQAMEFAFDRTLAFLLRRPGLTAFVLLMLVSTSMGLLPRVGSDFLPQADDGRLGISGKMAPGIQLATLDRQTRLIEQTIQEHVPELENMSVFIGDDAEESNEWNETRAIVQLVPRDERKTTSEEVRKRIMQSLPPIAGMKVTARVYGGLPISRRFASEGDTLAVLVRGHDRRTAERLAEQVLAEMKQIPGLINAEMQVDDRRPELVTHIDRAKASHLGVTVSAITQALETTFLGTRATVFREDGEEFNVLVRLQESDRSSKSDLDDVGIMSSAGVVIPLGNLVTFADGAAPMSIDRMDRQRVIAVTGATENRDLGAVVDDLQAAIARMDIPEGFQIEVAGDWEEQQESFTALTRGVVLAVLLMYMIMAAQFESLRDPLLILITLPLAGIGVLTTLVFWNTTLNVQSFIGLIVLAGVVVNNAIVLVDYANLLKRRHPRVSISTIIRATAVRRFRPVVMTTLTTVLGMLPIALGWGEGGELQAPMARVVIGGLTSGTVITLVAIPLVLQFVHGDPQEAASTASGAPVRARREPEPVAAA